MNDGDFKYWMEDYSKDELDRRVRAMREGGRDAFLKAYKQLIEAQEVYLARGNAAGANLDYIGKLFAKCQDAFRRNDTEAMKRGADECVHLAKIEDGAFDATYHELDAPGMCIVGLSYLLAHSGQ